jgi:hypothetical protein
MTIELQTGLPGACKTLYTLDRVEALRKKTGRPVFYHGINIYPDKLPDWQKLDDPKDWHKCPPESIVVLDEAQQLFRPRPNGSQVPEYESKLETHRHGGIDLILMTQRPRLVSVNVRELVGRHLHAHRTFGLQRSMIYQWSECKMNTQSRQDADSKTMYRFNKEVFTWYKSAEAHTVKASIPPKVWILLALLVMIPALIGYTWWHLSRKAEKAEKADPASAMTGQGASAGQAYQGGQQGGQAGKVLTSAEYVHQFQPRVPGLAYTAPVYDEVTKPVRAPYPAACYEMASKGCRCFTQQGTRLEVPKDLCQGIVAGGFFMAWDERKQEQRIEVNKAPALQPPGTREPLPGLINATPGYTPANSRPVSEQVADGQNLRHGKNNRIPG